MSETGLDRLERLETATVAPPAFARAVTPGRLEIVSFVHSCIYTGLLVCAFGFDNTQPLSTILGFGHGILWIAMSLVCLAAARYRIIPWWLAVCVTVLGGIGPFFGTVGFVVDSRRHSADPRPAAR